MKQSKKSELQNLSFFIYCLLSELYENGIIGFYDKDIDNILINICVDIQKSFSKNYDKKIKMLYEKYNITTIKEITQTLLK